MSRTSAPGKSRGFLTPSRLTAAGLGVLALIFIFGNTRETKIRLLIPEVSMPLWMALLGMGLIGLAIGWVLHSRR